MSLLHGKSFLLGRISSLTLSVLMLSVLTPYVSVHVCTGAGLSTCGGTMKLIRFHSGSIIASLCLLVPIVVGIMSSVIITKSSKKRTRDK